MPSTNSSSMPNVFDSSTVTTPSLPTLSSASAMVSPITGSAAEMDATWAISSFASMSLAWFLMFSTTATTARSMPRFRAMGLAPAATFLIPARTMARASTVAVVVPSPATSFVLVATSFASCAPMFSHGSSSSTSLAIVTPSFVIVGGPHFLSRTTLCPLGPSVIATVSASLFTPASSERRASSLNFSNLAAIGCLLRWCLDGNGARRAARDASPGSDVGRASTEDGEHVASGQDQILLALDLHLGAAVLRVDDRVALGDIHGNADAVLELARAYRHDGSLLGLLLRGVGDHQARRGGLVALARLHDDPVVQRLQLEVLRHAADPPLW